MQQPEFLPTTREEMRALGWDELDVLLVSGDAYVDSHAFGASLLGRWLVAHGYRAGIVAQPKWDNANDISRMGRPKLFAGVTAGAVDSLVAHYTAFRKKRGQDSYSPGGKMDLRPNRAAIVYTGLVRQAFPGLPVVLGGIEASLRRASHYDFWSDSLRRSVVLDAKAEAVLYGMGEKSILALAALFSQPTARQRPAEAIANARIPGTAYALHPDQTPADAVALPSHEAILAEPPLLIKATIAFERQMLNGKPPLAQRSGGRVVVFEPPQQPLSRREMDEVYGLPFTRRAHPSYAEPIPAVAMLEGSVTAHRGCGGGCSFCSLASHQGRLVQSRSEDSVLAEVERMAADPEFKGSITDIGGPSANMWNTVCAGNAAECTRDSCLHPRRCRNFKTDQEGMVGLLRRAASCKGVGHLRVASGVRHDLAVENEEYMKAVVGEFTGGQLKIAPEHITEKVLRLMRKPPVSTWREFLRAFDKHSATAGKEQYVIPYLMSAFPGCTDADMKELADWLRLRGWRPQQVQCFMPTPGTVATAMFYAETESEGRPKYVARSAAARLHQHRMQKTEKGKPPRKDYARPPRSGGERRRPPFQREGRPEGGDRGPERGDRRFDRGDRGPDRGDRKPARPFSRRPKDGPDREGGDAVSRPRKPFDRSSKPFDRSGKRPGPSGPRPSGPRPDGARPGAPRPGGKPGERKFGGGKPGRPNGPRSTGPRPGGPRPGGGKFGGKPGGRPPRRPDGPRRDGGRS